MDGTKPAMESNAEETQDEGQESKGTIIQPLTFAPFRVFFFFFPRRRSRLRQTERDHL